MAARRRRDYKAEYARRVAGTAPGSAERQAKRGHKPPPGKTEGAHRRERTMRKFGVSPSTLTRLRAAARDNIVSQLHAVGTRKWINEKTVTKGLAMLHANTLRNLALIDGGAIKQLASLDYGDVAANELFDDEDADEWEGRNPLWYG